MVSNITQSMKQQHQERGKQHIAWNNNKKQQHNRAHESKLLFTLQLYKSWNNSSKFAKLIGRKTRR
jgi:hypothetical protein